MNSDHIDEWRLAVCEHILMVSQVLDDRRILKSEMEKYLSKFFEWDEIEYSSDFKKITLKWKWNTDPTVKYENLHDLNIEWRMKSHAEEGFSYIVIEIYPWGIEEDCSEE